MYSEAELESAVASGKITREAADALRGHVSTLREAPLADEEQFRLITSFNDLFVAIAGLLVLIGAGWIGYAVWPPLSGLAVAGASWIMAEYFTAKRRMAFPSIVFFIAFVAGIYAFCTIWVLQDRMTGWNSRGFIGSQIIAAGLIVGASWLHWQRFMVPITVAVGVAAIARMLYTIIAWLAWPNVGQWLLLLVLAGGLCVFGYAMKWDMADRERKTRKSDVAFWLHLAASPMIVHPIFVLVGINLARSEAIGPVIAVLAIVIYALLGIVALIVDRRAILVSALIYVIAAAIYLAQAIGVRGAGFAAAIIVIGSSLLLLSAFWQALRRKVVPMLPPRLAAAMPVVA